MHAKLQGAVAMIKWVKLEQKYQTFVVNRIVLLYKAN
jgi:hypothetical protein